MSELIERCKERLEKNITVWCDWKDDIIELINKPMPAEPECDTELKCEWMKALRKLKAAEAKLEAAEQHVKILNDQNAEIMGMMERVRGLLPKWKEGDFNLPDYTRGKMHGRHECAKELQAELDGKQEKDDE